MKMTKVFILEVNQVQALQPQRVDMAVLLLFTLKLLVENQALTTQLWRLHPPLLSLALFFRMARPLLSNLEVR